MLQSFTPHHHLHHHLLSSSSTFLPLFSVHSYPLSSPGRPPPPPPLALPSVSVSPIPRNRAAEPWVTSAAQVDEPNTISAPAGPEAAEDEGPVELPSSTSSIFATTDNPTTLQVATSVLLTGAISVFLFRSVRRRVKRAKDLKFRSTGATKTLKEEALDNLKAMGTASIDAKAPPSPVNALIGAITAAVISVILYKFATTIEASLNRQTLSDSFSVRQITITVRTIINGICYLATFVFGLNSLGLFLYSGQLALNSFDEEPQSEENTTTSKDQLGTSEDGTEVSSSSGDKTSDDT